MLATIAPPSGPQQFQRIYLEVIVPVAEVDPRNSGFARILDAEGRTVCVETSGLVMRGSLQCARVRAFDVINDDYLVWATDEFVAQVRPVEGTPITVIIP